MKNILLPLLFVPCCLLAQQRTRDGIYSSSVVRTIHSNLDSSSNRIVVEGSNPAGIKISRTSDLYSFPKPIELTVYPNPAVSDTRAVFTSTENGLRYYLSVFSLDGKPLLQQTGTTVKGTNSIQFNMGNYPTGSYYLQLFDGNTKQTARFIKLVR